MGDAAGQRADRFHFLGVAQLGFQFFALLIGRFEMADVAGNHKCVRHPFKGENLGGHQTGANTPVTGFKRRFQIADSAMLRQSGQHLLPLFRVMPEADLPRGGADDFLARIAGVGCKSFIDVYTATVRHPYDGHRVGNGSINRTKTRFAFLQSGFGLFQYGNVSVKGNDTPQFIFDVDG